MQAITIEGQNAFSPNWTNAVIYVADGQNTHDQIQGIEGPNMHDQIVLCVFHSFLVEVQANAVYIHATHA